MVRQFIAFGRRGGMLCVCDLQNGRDHQDCVSAMVIRRHSWSSLADSLDPSSDGSYTFDAWVPHVPGCAALLWWLLGPSNCAPLAGRVPQFGGPARAILVPVSGRRRIFPSLPYTWWEMPFPGIWGTCFYEEVWPSSWNKIVSCLICFVLLFCF